MKKLLILLMTLILCFSVAPALAEGSATSPEFDPGITMSLPNPDWKVSISCDQAGKTLEVGSKVTLSAKISTAQPDYYNPSDYNISYNWQAKAPGGDWKTVGNDETYTFKLNADNVKWIFKVTVTLSK